MYIPVNPRTKYIEIPFDKKEFKNIKIPLIDKDELNRLENNPSYRSKNLILTHMTKLFLVTMEYLIAM